MSSIDHDGKRTEVVNVYLTKVLEKISSAKLMGSGMAKEIETARTLRAPYTTTLTTCTQGVEKPRRSSESSGMIPLAPRQANWMVWAMMQRRM